jgi:osmoprotectant transport system substrate-binding protein
VRCDPVAGKELVVLEDDKKLQTADNIIPAISAKAATPPLTEALDKVSAALSQDDLIALNRSTDLDRKPPAAVAKEFVQSKGLATGVSGGSGKIVVGAANFSENQTLANVYAEVLKGAGFDASVKTVGNRELYAPALQKGELQVVPEYVGTLTEFLNKQQNGASATPKATGEAEATLPSSPSSVPRRG